MKINRIRRDGKDYFKAWSFRSKEEANKAARNVQEFGYKTRIEESDYGALYVLYTHPRYDTGRHPMAAILGKP